MRIVRQAVVDVVADALVRAAISFGAAPSMGAAIVVAPTLRCLVGAEPGGDLVAGPLQEASLVVLAAMPPAALAAPIPALLAGAEAMPEGDVREAGLAAALPGGDPLPHRASRAPDPPGPSPAELP